MFSSGSHSAARPSFSLSLERPSTSRSRPDQGHTPSSAKGSMSKTRIGSRDEHLLPDARLTLKGGKKHHTFDERDAPYPLSYDTKMMDVDILDHIFLNRTRKSVTWVDFKDKPPTRSLDLGCGNGVWILEAAKAWKDCHFVGFDLVPIQPKLHLLPRDIANRIQWKHGNFLTERLPFEDDYFDHVNIYRIAWGISEMNWDGLFEEICRVLRPGGAIEIGEEDILFPTLPRSYTLAVKARPSAPYPRPSLTLSPPPSPLDDQLSSTTHAHAVLESLFFGVFESRMINLRPTAIIPHHLNIYFRNVLSTPSFEFPFPPPPIARQQLRHCPSDSTARPIQRREGSVSSVSTFESMREEDKQQQTPPTSSSSLCSSLSSLSDYIAPTQLAPSPRPTKPKPLLGLFNSSELSSVPLIPLPLLPPATVDVNDRDLALQLTAVYQRILSCKEAMWGELRRRLLLRRAGGPDLLQAIGWDDEAENDADSSDSGHGHGDGIGMGETRELERARERFEELIMQFERDLRYRTALADALQGSLGWPKPPPSPMSKHERAREAELEKAMAEAALAEADQELQCSRSFKCFVGFKEGKR